MYNSFACIEQATSRPGQPSLVHNLKKWACAAAACLLSEALALLVATDDPNGAVMELEAMQQDQDSQDITRITDQHEVGPSMHGNWCWHTSSAAKIFDA